MSLKNILFLVVSLLVTNHTKAQDTTYYTNQFNEETKNIKEATYYVVEEINPLDSSITFKEYQIIHALIKENRYITRNDSTLIDGQYTTWYDNGQKRSIKKYTSGRLDTIYMEWDRNGNELEPIYSSYEIDQPADFEGGMKNMYKYVARNTKYPKLSKDRGDQGRVLVSFVIDTNGKVTQSKVISSIDPLLDQEALRVVNSMPNWKPAMHNNYPVNTRYNIPIRFKLN